MAKGGDIIALGKALEHGHGPHRSTLVASGRQAGQCAGPAQGRVPSVNEFVKVLIEAVVIVLAVSFISLGLHKRPGNHPLWKRLHRPPPRPGGGHHHSAGAGRDVLAMWYWGIGLHKISLGSLIIALGLLVDDAIIAPSK